MSPHDPPGSLNGLEPPYKLSALLALAPRCRAPGLLEMAASPAAPPSASAPVALAQPAPSSSSPPSSQLITTLDPPPTGSPPSRSTRHPPAARKRFSLDLPLLRRRLSPRSAEGHAGHVDDERPIGHQARVLCALITGVVPEPAQARSRARVLSLESSPSSSSARWAAQTDAVVSRTLSSVSVAGPQVQQAHAQGVRARKGLEEEDAHGSHGHECRAVPHVKPKALKKLKADLVKADKARAIVADLKRLEVPLDEPSAPSSSCVLVLDEQAGARPALRKVVRAYALAPIFEAERVPPAVAPTSSPPSPPSPPRPDPTVRLVSFGADLPPMSPGALGGLAGAKSGAFELLADVSGALVEKSGAHEGVYGLPQDRVSVLICASSSLSLLSGPPRRRRTGELTPVERAATDWWGFEIALPPPAIRTLSSVASVQSSFFTFLQAFTLAGGASFLSSSSARADQAARAHLDIHSLARAGAPELAPFVRYISSYCDMEWQAIKAQNRGALRLSCSLACSLGPPVDISTPRRRGRRARRNLAPSRRACFSLIFPRRSSER